MRRPFSSTRSTTTIGDSSVVDVGLLALGTSRDLEFVVPDDQCPAEVDGTASVAYEDYAGLAHAAGDTATFEVLDVTAPTLNVRTVPDILWPPNHRLETVEVLIEAVDECDPDPIVRLVSVTSNEPANGLGDGDAQPDIVGVDIGQDDRILALRSERSGTGMVVSMRSSMKPRTPVETSRWRVPSSSCRTTGE